MSQLSLQEWVDQSIIPCSPSKPFLVILSGLSGSGKSTVSRYLAEHYGAAWISSDIERKRLYGLTSEESGRQISGFYSREATKRTFTHMAQLASQLLKYHYPVILDSCALKQAERNEFAKVARNSNVPYQIIFCHAPVDTLTSRVCIRQHSESDASEASPEIIKRQKEWLERPDSGPGQHLTLLDTSHKNWLASLTKAVDNLL